MSRAELLAVGLQRLLAGRWHGPASWPHQYLRTDEVEGGRFGAEKVEEYARLMMVESEVRRAPVVDITRVWESVAVSDRDSYVLAEDFGCCRLPWEYAWLAWESTDPEMGGTSQSNFALVSDITDTTFRREREEPAGTGRTILGLVWVVSATTGAGDRAAGPLLSWNLYLTDEGRPITAQWSQLHAALNDKAFEMVCVGTTAALDFLNCRNVELVEPRRERHERRRIERTGVRVSELWVFPAGKTYATSSELGQPVGWGGPASPVRGHFAHYGPEWNRGLLFGKYSGRFYIPQHVRGNVEQGTREQRFVLAPDVPRA